MPDFNIYAVSNLIGWQSTALSFFLLIPSLVFGWRDCVNYFDPSINIYWTFAEIFSLVGLLLVPEPLVTQIILVAWYLVADLLLFAEAVMIEGWFGVKVQKMMYAKRRAYWEGEKTRNFLLKRWAKDSRAKDRVAEEIMRANDEDEREYAGARWRRDVEWQLLALTTGMLIGPCLWYPLFFMNGQASIEYDWASSDIARFDARALGGWVSGIVSSVIYLFARIQADYRFRNWVKSALNRLKGYKNGHSKRHVMAEKPPPDGYAVCATCIVVYLAFIMDNLCQVVSILIICKGQDYQTRVKPYLEIQAPWLACAVLSIAVDGRAIFGYIGTMSRDRSGAKTHGKWWYPRGQFPHPVARDTLDHAFESYLRKYSPRNIDVGIERLAKTDRGARNELQNKVERVKQRYENYVGHQKRSPPKLPPVLHDDWRSSLDFSSTEFGSSRPSSKRSSRPSHALGHVFDLPRAKGGGRRMYKKLQKVESDTESS
ncbi:hypothetical protein ACM66B_004541 [Microbotryomycetes sp. NB124-2]